MNYNSVGDPHWSSPFIRTAPHGKEQEEEKKKEEEEEQEQGEEET